jgi:lipopolysaccharide export system permease protein
LKGELYGRLAKALVLPLLTLLGLPLGLSAKRSGRAPGMIVGGVLLLAFFHAIQLGQGLAATGRLSAELAVGGPLLVFALIAVTVFATSLRRPGDTPVGRALEYISSMIARFRPKSTVASAA